jgi:peptidoglycan lytic transglycosylase
MRGRVSALAVGAAVLTAGSLAAVAPAASTVQMAGAGSNERVSYGESVDVTGQVPQGKAGQDVHLEHAPAGEGWRTVKSTSTSSGGSYRFDVKAERSGAYRAVAAGSGTSAEKRVTVVARLSGRGSRYVKRGSSVRVKGALRPGLRGRRVALQLRSGKRWKTVDRARTGRGGRFRAAFRPSKVGSFRLRVRFGGDSRNAAVSRTLRGKTYVLRPGHASWYGPGLYGNKLGCGGTLTPSTVGVANKSLPCGTKVLFRYKGRTATIPVVDRGPYVGGRDWDLTAGAKRKLGFGSTGTVWTSK